MFILEYFYLFVEYILRDPFTQITGFMGMAVILTAYFQKDDITVKKLMLLSTLFWGTHFYLLGVYTGLASVVIWVFRLLLSMKYQKNIYAFGSIITGTIIIGYFTYDGLISLIPIITSMIGAYSYFYLEKIALRVTMLFVSVLWLIFHMSIGSLSGAINEGFTQIILIITIYRMMHPAGGSVYYMNKVRDILWKTSHPDYDRFVFIRDKVTNYKNILGHNFQQILHYDLRAFLGNQKSKFSNQLLSRKKDQSAFE